MLAKDEYVSFGSFQVGLYSGELCKHGLKIRLQHHSFQVLTLLLERAGQVVTREELHQKLWPEDTFVDFDAGLNTAIKRLRDALNDSAESPRFVETVPRRGYRFIAPIAGGANVPIIDPKPRASELASESVSLPAVPPAENLTDKTRPWAEKGRRTRPVILAFVPAAILLMTLTAAFLLDLGGVRKLLWFNTASSPIRSIAVLPLENLSGDVTQDYFTDGITDALTTDLAQIRALRVISRTSAMQYKSTKKSLTLIGSELSVDAIVEGTVTRIGERVRVTTQLIDARSDRHLWAETYEDNLGDILALQSEVARAIANQIKIQVTPQEQTRLAQVQLVVPEAYEAYLRGRYLWNRRTEDSLKKAVDYFQWTVDKDPSYAPAYSGLADSYVAFASFRVSPANDSYIKAKVAAVRALELDPRLPEALSALAMVHLYYEWNWAAAELAFKRALELNPDDGTTRMRYALALPYFGRFDDALREIARAREADPLSPVISANVGKILHLARRYEQAIAEHRKAVALDPNFGLAHNNLGLTLALTGRYEQAIAEFQRAIELSGNAEAKANLAYAYAMCGRSREAREILSELQTGTPPVYSSPFDLAVAYTGLGDRDSAFAWLEKAYEERARPLLSIKINPLFDPLHSDPRFAALIERMKVFDVR
jgi:TolB-like protein/DNA-binding winged helix-turn-helix (wHTH) protein/Flp pilus assembly protein TadD